jgi:hypothetical protein
MPDDAEMLGPGELRKTYDSLLGQLQALAPRLGDRRSAAAVQELGLRLGYFALALQQQMDGDIGKAESSLARADARAARMPSFFSSDKPLDGEDWTQVYH